MITTRENFLLFIRERNLVRAGLVNMEEIAYAAFVWKKNGKIYASQRVMPITSSCDGVEFNVYPEDL